jgi:hypothetical protein
MYTYTYIYQSLNISHIGFGRVVNISTSSDTELEFFMYKFYFIHTLYPGKGDIISKIFIINLSNAIEGQFSVSERVMLNCLCCVVYY